VGRAIRAGVAKRIGPRDSVGRRRSKRAAASRQLSSGRGPVARWPSKNRDRSSGRRYPLTGSRKTRRTGESRSARCGARGTSPLVRSVPRIWRHSSRRSTGTQQMLRGSVEQGKARTRGASAEGPGPPAVAVKRMRVPRKSRDGVVASKGNPRGAQGHRRLQCQGHRAKFDGLVRREH
jgi:hypothetical protein